MNLKRIVILPFFSFITFFVNAQAGLNFQGVARSSNNAILASQPISLRLSILQGSANGIVEYVEVRKVNTNAQGLFSVVIGDEEATNRIGSISTINWKNTPKFLKIEMDAAAGNNFTIIGTTQFQYVAYAQFAKSVDAENIAGIIPVEKGGTGVGNISALKNVLDLGSKANLTDLNTGLDNKVDKVVGKTLSTNDYTTVEKTKLAAITGTNTGDQDLSSYATISSLGLKANISDVNTSLALKENTTNKSSATDLGGLNPSDILYPTQKAVKAYVAANNASGGIADGGVTTSKLADAAVTNIKIGELVTTTKGGTGVSTTTANTIFAGPNGTSGTPSFRTLVAADLPTDATSYIQNSTTQQNSSNFNISGYGVIGKKLTINGFDLSVGGDGTELSNIAIGKDALRVVASIAGIGGNENIAIGTGVLKENTNGLSNTAIGYNAQQVNTTGGNNTSLGAASLNNNTIGSANTAIGKLTLTQNTIGDGNTAIGLSALGSNRTGSYNTAIGANADLISNNLTNATAIGNGAIVAASNTIQLGNGSITNVNTSGVITAAGFSGPLSGNATTATFSGNITANINTTLTTLSNLSNVGTITTGVWSASAISVASGGTGLTTTGTSGQVLTSTGSGTLTWTGSHYIGEAYGGGIIFYVYDGGKHGLIAATSDQGLIAWDNGSSITTKAIRSGINGGNSNTERIVLNQGLINYAAQYCANYNGGNYGDWYLPSKYELNLLYQNRLVIGGFENSFYWSSTEDSDNTKAWGLSFFFGTESNAIKSGAHYVRAIRSF